MNGYFSIFLPKCLDIQRFFIESYSIYWIDQDLEDSSRLPVKDSAWAPINRSADSSQ